MKLFLNLWNDVMHAWPFSGKYEFTVLSDGFYLKGFVRHIYNI